MADFEFKMVPKDGSPEEMELVPVDGTPDFIEFELTEPVLIPCPQCGKNKHVFKGDVCVECADASDEKEKS